MQYIFPSQGWEIKKMFIYLTKFQEYRYDVGDIGVPDNELCVCGRTLPLMKSIEGRADDFIVLPSGKIVSPIVLALIMKHSEDIIEYQIVQERLEKVIIYLVVSPEFNEDDSKKIGQEIKRSLNNEINVEIKIKDKIQRDKSGKIRSVISKVKTKI